MTKTTAKHFKVFTNECKRLIKEFGISGYEIYYAHQKLEGAFADCRSNLTGRVITLRLTTDWDDSINPLGNDELKKSAKHEVIHILINRLNVLAQLRYITEPELEEATEEVVRMLEKIIK